MFRTYKGLGKAGTVTSPVAVLTEHSPYIRHVTHLSHFILTVTLRGALRFPFVLPMGRLRQGQGKVTFPRSPRVQEAALAVNLGSLAPQPCS